MGETERSRVGAPPSYCYGLEAMKDDAGDMKELDRARRHFLKAAAYTAPAILATITLNKAHAQASCMPATCPPGSCPPSTGCMPAGGCMPG
jgi:hypothetical protein